MSKELEALKEVGNYRISDIDYCVKDTSEYDIIETALKDKEQTDVLLEEFGLSNIQNFIDNLKIVVKEQKKLVALEIIKEKEVDIVFVKRYKTVEEYNNAMDYISKNGGGSTKHLTKAEFDLLKEVLL